MKEKVTFICTSCGRFELLQNTIKTFKKYNTYPIEKYIIIDNSCYDNKDLVIKMFDYSDNIEIIFNNTNIGQVSSIDLAYSKVETEYIFHCEDDWEFFNNGFIEKSLSVLKDNTTISNINIRIRFSGDRGSMQPIEEIKNLTEDGVVYYLFKTHFLNEYHGFSWNPGLRRLSDYKKIGDFKQFINEQGANKIYYENGYRAACLEDFYCKHAGEYSITPLSNC